MLLKRYGKADSPTYSRVGLPLLMLGIGLSAAGTHLNRRAGAGEPVEDAIVIAVFVLASVLIGASIAFNVASLRAGRRRGGTPS
jgi:predicted membrane protein